ncbi:aminotransferase class IV [Nocardia sp. NPDC058379]|uniref:aminotransferase class IV n=1 Tax=unclassified Nocardia TaxID=2637762 RepID=UPI00364BE4D0
MTVFDPRLELGKPGAAADPQILVTHRKASATPMGPSRLRSAVYARDLPRVKHNGLFGAMHQRAAAQRAGFDDVVFTASAGEISEIATSNVGFIRDGQFQAEWQSFLTFIPGARNGRRGRIREWITRPGLPALGTSGPRNQQ